MFENYTYLDNASITRLDERVFEEMKPYFFDIYAIPTSESGYSMGVEAREVLEKSRETIAEKLNAQSSELIFTSGYTESSNIALKGVALALEKKKGNHIIVSKIEDYSVLNTAKALEKQGFKVTYLEVDQYGLVDSDVLNEQITSETILVSIQHANQEIGTLQDIKALGEVCKDNGVLFHTDVTHTFTRTPLDLEKTSVDLATISAHTIHGPAGIGALYISKGTPITKWMDGGFQESNRRAGLENIPGAVGFARASQLVTPEENQKMEKMRNHLIERILSEVPKSILNGHDVKRVPQNANITFEYVEGESITLHLDMRGFAVSTGSACFSRSLDPSHVILGIGGDHERAHGSVRFTLGRFTTPEQIDAACDAVTTVVENLRKISPLGNQ
ncbi:cysteine desulfurase family protein [Methanobacterium sp.]|uniref:cysteine desulfurase family protein n=1 Tax=Methanobacterium sp. TaxID=2164 RepID=UPI0025DB4274|nr:cysteine desulfurase family protein [Methanobacterium sp.]MBI5460369.1 cysteine desulfurase [Methanobacterium sp.]